MAHIVFEAVTKQFGETVAVDEVSFTIPDGEFFCLVGPSGCGKTTTLRLIAGLEQPTSGTVQIGEQVVNELPPQKRDITMVFQDLALFPHMTVRKNIDFSLRMQKVPENKRKELAQEAAQMVQIGDLLDRPVTELSGGQQQRVALARSAIRETGVFLLDEPLSNLDANLKIDIRGELQKLHQKLETTMVYVTHDQEEAMTMADRIAVMNKGRIQQIGTPKELYHKPTNAFVARFIGTPNINFFDTTIRKSGTETKLEHEQFILPLGINKGFSAFSEGSQVTIGVRPEDVILTNSESDGLTAAEVLYTEALGSTQYVYINLDGQEVRAEIDPGVSFDSGDQVHLSMNREKIHYFSDTGENVTQLEAPSIGQQG